MAEPTKDFKSAYDRTLVEQLAADISDISSGFPAERFIADVMETLESLEMKARATLIAHQLSKHLPGDYTAQLETLIQVTVDQAEDGFWHGFTVWPLTVFVREFGLEHFSESMGALNHLTRLFTAEFAVRPFIQAYPEQMLALFAEWAQDPDEHVRRLVSEGSRPRLPWGIRLSEFVDNPHLTLPLLEQLKDDPSEYVRRSVANHLNDMTKDNPDVVLKTTKRWMKDAGKDRERLVRHALRTLVKAGDAKALAILGYNPDLEVELQGLQVSKRVQLGDALDFEFELVSKGAEDATVVVDFVIHHVKKNGERTPKTFKLKQVKLVPSVNVAIAKQHKMRPISTRTYYGGMHRIEVMANGKILGGAEFELVI